MGKRELETFQAALGLDEPWFIAESRFDEEAGRLDIDISFMAGARFTCPCCGAAECRVYDARPRAGLPPPYPPSLSNPQRRPCSI